MSALQSLRTHRVLPALLTLALLAPLFPKVALADNAAAPSPGGSGAGYDAALGAPETAGVGGSPQSPVSVDPSTGTATVSIPFALPKARGQVQPGLGLAYNSAATESVGGYGWSLGVHSIWRAPLSGPPKYQDAWTTSDGSTTNADRIVFDGAPLVGVCAVATEYASANCPGHGYTNAQTGDIEPFPAVVTTGWMYFRLEAGSSDVRLFWSPDHLTWLVQYKSGETLELGKPLGSDASGSWFGAAIDWDRDNPTSAYRWNLVRQYDAETSSSVPVNRILYQWSTLPGDTLLYLTDVFYTALASTAATYPSNPGGFADHVHLAYTGPMATPPVPSFVPPVWRAAPNLVVSHVDVTAVTTTAGLIQAPPVSRRLVERYWLNHKLDQDGATSNRVILYESQIEGRCATAGADMEQSDYTVSATSDCPMLPATQYGYQALFASHTQTTLSGTVASNVAGTFLYDVNSDGVADVVVPSTPSGTTFPSTAAVSLVSAATTANSLGTAQTYTVKYPTGFTTTPPSYAPNWFYNGNGNSPFPSQTIPGDFSSDGALDLLMAGESVVGDGLQFARLVPMPATFGLVGDAAFYLPAWQTGALDTATSVGSGVRVYAESVLAVVDVDGDGYPDAITDTPTGPETREIGGALTFPAGPGWHALALRSTVANVDGSISPFAAVRAGAYTPGASSAPGPLPFYPAAGQYYALLSSTAPGTDSDARLFAQGASPPPITLFADMNADGIVDWVTMDNRGGNFLYWVGHGDGTFGSCTDGANTCTGDARFQGATPATALADMPALPPGSKVFVHDVSGDGFADLIVATTAGVSVYLNQGGTLFQAGVLVGSGPTAWSLTNAQIFFADMNGSGVDDLVLVQDGHVSYMDLWAGLRPGLLTTISNGYGATTTITYQTTNQLAVAAEAAGNPWTTSTPQLLHHVVSVRSSNGMPAPFAETHEIDYAYRNPVYDPRDRELVDFQQVTARTIGDANEPTMSVQTTYLSGICALDRGTSCPPTGVDRPYLPLRGLPTSVFTFDDLGRAVSMVHTEYDVHEFGVGLDGRGFRSAYPRITDTWLADSSVAVSSHTQNTAQVSDAMFDDPSGSVASYSLYLPLGGLIVHTQQGEVRDALGNATVQTDLGVLSSTAAPRGGTVDSPIVVSYGGWQVPAGDPTQYQWRPTIVSRPGFTAPSGVSATDAPVTVTLAYAADGQVTSASSTLAGALPLARSSLGTPAPATAAPNSTNLVTSFQYDAYGNETMQVTGGGLSCAQTEYDPSFAQWATTKVAFRDGCTAAGVPNSVASVTTQEAWDPGIGEVTTRISATGATTGYGYDGFGRALRIYLPDPTLGSMQQTPTVSFTYYDNTAVPSQETGYPVKQTLTQVVDGSATRQFWTYADAWGQPLVRLSPGDTSQGDTSAWIVRGQALRTARGAVTRAFAPYYLPAGDSPSQFPFSALPTAPSATAVYDAFGRVVKTVGLDGATVTSLHAYHALEDDVQDAEQAAGGHVGASSYTVWDGHNRVTRRGSIVHPDGGGTTYDEIVLSTAYTAGGKPWVITQSHSLDPTVVQRTLQYDSLGHLVGNVEANTSASGTGWRYVYDAAGRLVGTSDDRGCGENLGYDGLGRLLWEDYSPCASGQTKYSAGPFNTTTGILPATTMGAEAIYYYDQQLTSSALSGELSSSYDRASATTYAYDARARVTGTTRALATPQFTSRGSINAAGNYASYTFGRTFQYDNLDRLTAESTGADVTQLLGTDMTGAKTATSESLITATYSARGTIASVQGSYGTLLKSNVVDADGAPLTQVLGDAAGTTAFRCYSPLRMVNEVGVLRNAALPTCAHAAVGAPASPVSTAQTVLVADQIQSDLVGNPTFIQDARNASEWKPGSLPVVTRTMTYDDSYRLTKIQQTYAGTGNDIVVPTTPATTTYQNPVQPIAAATNRVKEQDFAYDFLGNTTSSTDDEGLFFERSLSSQTNGAQAVGPNQLSSATNGSGTANVYYDNAGNVTEIYAAIAKCPQTHCEEIFLFEWDELGRLASATRDDDSGRAYAANVAYTYAANGARVLRASTQPDGTTYDAEVFPSLRLDNASWQAATSTYQRDDTTETAYLVFGGSSYGKVIYASPGNVTPATPAQHVFLTVSDMLGSTAAVIDKATGELVERTTYEAYGGLDSDYHSPDWGSFNEEYKYTGKQGDVELGITYFGARYYSPYLGRWLSPDPLAIHAVAGDPNPYAFVHGGPLAYTDPTGLDSGCDNLSSGCTGGGDGDQISGSATWSQVKADAKKAWDWTKRAAAKGWSDAGKGLLDVAKGVGDVGSAASDLVGDAGDAVKDVGHAIGCLFGGCSKPPPPPPPPSTASSWAANATHALLVSNNPAAQFLQSDRALMGLQNGIAAATVGTEIGLVTGGVGEFLAGGAEATEATAAEEMAVVRQVGSEGETAANIIKNTERIASASETAEYRIPDVLDHDARIIGEVKNVAELSYTNQLRDFASYAEANGYTFQLIVRTTTSLSGPLQQAVDSGAITLLRTLL